jgi:starch phosphorylase
MGLMWKFGLKAEEVLEYNHNRSYKAWDEYHSNPLLREILEQLNSDYLTDNPREFRNIYDSLLLYNDEFFVLKDFAAYMESFREVQERYSEQEKWLKSSLHNIAQSGIFSSDRTVREYAHQVWRVRCRRIEH